MALNRKKLATRLLILLAIAGIIGVASAELFARYYLGLGTPPLWVSHPKIEYMYKPSQDVKRFGNRFLINAYGMRSPKFAQTKQDDEALRVVVFGDSVINGGNLSSHENLATSLVGPRLEAKQREAGEDGKVIVGNVSAGSWGPGNWLGYAQTYGFFDADILVLVLSSHDYGDVPTFGKLSPKTHPTSRPLSALSEGFIRYLPRYLPKLNSSATSPAVDAPPTQSSEQAIASAMKDLEAFLVLAQEACEHVVVLQHWTTNEIDSVQADPGFQHIAELSEKLGIETHSLGDSFAQAIRSGQNPYRDHIHPNNLGQKVLADAMEQALASYLGAAATD